MPVDVVMPKLGESVTEGTVVRWLKREGDTVARDEPVLEIATDKIDTEVPAVAAGVLHKILVEEGQTVPVGQKLAVIETEQTEIAEKTSPASDTQPVSSPAPPTPARIRETSPGKRFYSPLVRRIAKTEGIALSTLDEISGSGNGGRVTKRDVLRFVADSPDRNAPNKTTRLHADEPPALVYTAEEADTAPMDTLRKTIAEHMIRSKRTSPHVTQFTEVDMTAIVRFREEKKDAFQRKEGFKLTLTPFFIAVMVDALRTHPLLNASVDRDKIVYWKHVNFGIAVGLEKGVVVPVIRHAEAMNFLGIARAAQDLAVRAHGRKLGPDELQGGTFTLTNPGMYGTLFGTPILHQPQVGIMATGAVKKRVVVLENDAMAICSMMYLSLTYDHRIVDGLNAAHFSQTVVHGLEHFDLNGLGW
ncbi:MAG: 2-oxo acid dehydrogenase subunit E2 [candidate division Zixibacteria bacterium]|nr:2-oxo acid dehydrogenase subunit E2 [candidate division Zixibacteria bacterium]